MAADRVRRRKGPPPVILTKPVEIETWIKAPPEEALKLHARWRMAS